MLPGGVEHENEPGTPDGSPACSDSSWHWLDPGKLHYFKRYRMEIGLEGLPVPQLAEGYSWQAWDDSLREAHAEVLLVSFHESIDTIVFPSLGSRTGCLYLMREISRRPGFAAEATWLIRGPGGVCGSIQGIRERSGMGAIQNIGIVPAHRGHGLGAALLLQALHGFRRLGLGRAMLEVTAENATAIRLYRRLGFLRRKTLYKPVEVPDSAAGALAVAGAKPHAAAW